MLEDCLAHIRIVLVSTSHPGNIGAAARALKTMGLSRLALVTPRYDDALRHADALAFATGAADVLEHATIHATLDEALQGCTWAGALTARNREISVPEFDVRGAAAHAAALCLPRDGNDGSAEIAFVFGSERYGLDNEDVMKCQACCTVPTGAYSSLNLAQAIQIVAYECRLAMQAAFGDPSTETSKPEIKDRLATIDEREQFFDHLQEALIAIEFLNAEYPKKLMQRLRRLFARTSLEHEEVNILRGICTAILSPRRK